MDHVSWSSERFALVTPLLERSLRGIRLRRHSCRYWTIRSSTEDHMTAVSHSLCLKHTSLQRTSENFHLVMIYLSFKETVLQRSGRLLLPIESPYLLALSIGSCLPTLYDLRLKQTIIFSFDSLTKLSVYPVLGPKSLVYLSMC